MNRSENISTLAAALATAQSEMKPAIMNSVNPHFKNRYADLASVMEAARPISQNGIAIIQSPSVTMTDGVLVVAVETLLIHSSGEWISERMEIAIPDIRGGTLVQQVGSIITYLRRYMLSAMGGVVADEDTDGNSPTPPRSAPPRPVPPTSAAPPPTSAPVGETVDLFEYRYGDGTLLSPGNAAERDAFREYLRGNGEAPPPSLLALRAWYAMQKQAET